MCFAYDRVGLSWHDPCILEDFKIQLLTTCTSGLQQSHSQTSFLYCWEHCCECDPSRLTGHWNQGTKNIVPQGIKWVTACHHKWLKQVVPSTLSPQGIKWVTASSTKSSGWSQFVPVTLLSPGNKMGYCFFHKWLKQVPSTLLSPGNKMGYCFFHKWLKQVPSTVFPQGIKWVTACHHGWLKLVPMLNVHRM